MTRGRGVALGATVCAVGALLTGCGNPEPYDGSAQVRVEGRTAPADEAVHVRVTGLAAGQDVTVTSETRSPDGLWRSRADFTADGDGVVDLDTDKPHRGGSWRKADGMAWLWSMTSVKWEDAPFRLEFPEEKAAFTVRIDVTSRGDRIGSAEVTRTRMAEGVRHRALTVAEDGVRGSLYLPPAGAPKAAPALLLGGSEGGDSMYETAALLASRGHPALSLCYFDCEGRPEDLKDIDLDYFADAAKLLAGQEQSDGRRLVVMGVSRGSEAAQLLGQRRPELVEDVVAFAASNEVWPAFPVRGNAWTDGGKPVPQGAIPLDRVRGDVLANAGGEDKLWDAAELAEPIEEHGELMVFPRAGHDVSGPPHLPAYPISGVSAEGDSSWDFGGTRAAGQAAKAATWPRVLELLRE